MKVRTEILLVPKKAWKKIGSMAKNGYIDVTPSSFARITTFGRFKSALMTDEEQKFADEYWVLCGLKEGGI